MPNTHKIPTSIKENLLSEMEQIEVCGGANYDSDDNYVLSQCTVNTCNTVPQCACDPDEDPGRV